MSVKFLDDNNFELRICFSLLSGQSISITNINNLGGGITKSQECFIDLILKISDNSEAKINKYGNKLIFEPGTLIGGEIEFECHESDTIGHYILYLLLLYPFCRDPLDIKLYGITDRHDQLSAETVYYGFKDIITEFVGPVSEFKCEIKKRGPYPKGGGEVIFSGRPVKSLKSIDKVVIGKINKIRGTVWCNKVNPTMNKRMISGAKSVLLKYTGDVYFTNDYRNAPFCGDSPGMGLIICATTASVLLVGENKHEKTPALASYVTGLTSKCAEELTNMSQFETPEELGVRAAKGLINQCGLGGIVSDCIVTPIVFALMALGPKNVSRAVMSKPNIAAGLTVRDIYLFFGIKFSFKEIHTSNELYRAGTEEIICTCIGSGMVNLSTSIR